MKQNVLKTVRKRKIILYRGEKLKLHSFLVRAIQDKKNIAHGKKKPVNLEFITSEGFFSHTKAESIYHHQTCTTKTRSTKEKNCKF